MLIFAIVATYLVALANGLSVTVSKNVTIPTHTSLVQYTESIHFEKTIKNDAVHLQVTYTVSKVSSAPLETTWTFNGKPIEVTEPGKRSTLYAERNYDADAQTMTIVLNVKDSSAVAGEYTLTAEQESQVATGTGTLESAPILPLYSKPKRVLQGDRLRISCAVQGWPRPKTIQWFFASIKDGEVNELKPLDLGSRDWAGASLEQEGGTPNDTLRFTELIPANNGLFACNTTNKHGNDSTFLLVDVKDRWAALWPFIGIVVEVTLLVALILFYERYQMRAKPAAENNANAHNAVPSNGNTNVDRTAKPEEVRQRTSAKA